MGFHELLQSAGAGVGNDGFGESPFVDGRRVVVDVRLIQCRDDERFGNEPAAKVDAEKRREARYVSAECAFCRRRSRGRRGRWERRGRNQGREEKSQPAENATDAKKMCSPADLVVLPVPRFRERRTPFLSLRLVVERIVDVFDPEAAEGVRVRELRAGLGCNFRAIAAFENRA